MNLPRKILHNTLIQVIGKIASTGLNLFAFALITRELGRGGFGEYTTVITFLSFFAIIADLGLTLVTVQMINSQPDKEDSLLANLFGLRLVSALIFIGLAPSIVFLFDYSDGVKIGVLIAAASFIFTALNQIMIGLFQSRLKMDRVAWAETLSRFILIIGVIISIKQNWGLNGMLVATSAASLVSFLLHFFFARRFARIRPRFDWPEWRRIIHLSWPLAVTIAFNLIYLRADTLILSFLKSPETVGLYGAAYKIIDVLSSLPFMFAGIVLPLLTAAWVKQDRERFNKILQKSFDIMAIASIPIVIGTQFLAKEIIILIAGPEFADAGLILQVLIIAVGAIFLGNVLAHAIIAIEAQKKVIGLYIFTGISSLLAYFLLIPHFSYFGAAAVTVYSESIITLLISFFIYRQIKFKLNFSSLKKALIASLIMGAGLWIRPDNLRSSSLGLLISLLTAGLIYFFCLYIFKTFKQSDIDLITNKT
jgi:O-antigen/teichoic acid export membrane protein